MLLWVKGTDETYWTRLRRVWDVMETTHTSNTDICARFMRLVFSWEISDFYMHQRAAHPAIFDAADSAPSSSVSSRLPDSGADAQASEAAGGSGAVSSCPPVDAQQRNRQSDDGTYADGHLDILRAHGWGSSRGTKINRRSLDFDA